MPLALNSITLNTPDAHRAADFYSRALAPAVTDRGGSFELDLHSHGAFELATGADPTPSGFRGYVLTYLVDQPCDVRTVMDAALDGGAEALKPAKKALFGAYSGVFRATDGAVWKVAAGTSKDSREATPTPVPTETTLILGVGDPKESKTFYETLGMATDRDYGSKYIDFRPAAGATRLSLMQRPVLAKDAGIDPQDESSAAMILVHRTGSPEDVDALLAAAVSAGGKIAAPAAPTDDGYAGQFTDPDGFRWTVAS
ncbi:VOC family protein [Ruania halotolerans]|uniref:VOC family protein n=1 Tax=Ruania halotolerans TaxID=2897773 RepID=UPI001E3E784E|nr:VOC family protein [Ruania halotolerans]UFU07026.1 VOC family protein [Ruania halotolerans]